MTDKEIWEIKELVLMMREAGVRYRASKPVIELLEGGADEIEQLAEQVEWLRTSLHSATIAHPTQIEIEYDKRDVLRKARHYVRAVLELIQEFADRPFILNEIDAALAKSYAPTRQD